MKIHNFVIPEPFSVGNVNVYLLESELITLIDTGPNSSEAQERLMYYLDGLGLSITDIDQIILTHRHPDHTGLSDVLAKSSGARVFIHGAELDSSAQCKKLVGIDEHYDSLFVKAGLTIDEIKQIYGIYHNLYNLPVMEYKEIQDGQKIYIDKKSFLQVIHTPGHTSGHVCLWEPKQRILFSGDQVLEKAPPLPSLEVDNYGNKIRNFKKYFESLQKIQDLDIKYVFPGHGCVIDDITDIVSDVHAYLKRRKKQILDILDDDRLRVIDIARKMYTNLGILDTILAISKVWGFLEILEDEKIIAATEIEGVNWFRKR